jgi:acyl carrier protein
MEVLIRQFLGRSVQVLKEKKMEHKQAVEMICECLQDNIDSTMSEEKQRIILEADENTRLFGGDGFLDSLGVVILLSDLEDLIDEKLDVVISLANDATMSKFRSPFRTLGSLAEFVIKVVEVECES